MSNKNKDENEVDCSCYGFSQKESACPQVRNITHPLRYYEFTPEEMKALEECDKESFYYRCLPFSTLLATLTYTGIKCGLLNPNPHFGVVPKVMLAAFLGHCYGRLSYIPKCEARLRRLSSKSHLGNVMRRYHSEKIDCKKK